ncbi:MAG: hypothetical protein NTV43_17950 [Methylococcales bacterium]|nr:hypothetical protein [Methylococcales bacterium]
MSNLSKQLGQAQGLPILGPYQLLASVARWLPRTGFFALTMLVLAGSVFNAPVALAANAKPKAVITAVAPVNEGATVTLDGSKSSDKEDKTVTSYSWQQTKGPAVTLNRADPAKPSFVAPAIVKTTKPTVAVKLTFKLTVKDKAGAEGSSTVVVTVKPVNAAPVANAGADQTVVFNTLVKLNGSASHDDGKLVSYAWKQLNATKATTVKLINPKAVEASFTSPNTDASLVFELTVIDNDKAKHTDTVTVTVASVLPLKASFGVDQTSFTQGGQVAASVSSISGGTKPYSVKFDWGDTSTADVSTLAAAATSKTVNHIYSEVGTYNLAITLTDAKNLVKTQSFTITTVAKIPDLAGTLKLTQASVTFNTAAEAKIDVTGGTGPYTVKFDWGDTKSETFPLAAGVASKTASHFYELVGTYSINVTITDAKGNSKSYPVSVTIKPKAVDPLAACNS